MDVVAFALAMAIRPKTVRHVIPAWTTGLLASSDWASLVALDDGVTVIQAGGGTPNSPRASVQKYIKNSGWSAVASMAAGRFFTQGAAVGRTVYIPGGSGTYNPFSGTNTMYAYDVDGNVWTSKATLPEVRYNVYAASKDHLVYIWGNGGGFPGYPLEYNTITNTYAVKAAVVGGWGTQVGGVIYYGNLYTYDPVSDTTTAKASPTALGVTMPGLIGVLNETQLVSVGGSQTSNTSGDARDHVLVYDIPSNTWSIPTYDKLGTPSNVVLPSSVYRQSVAGLKDGSFVVYVGSQAIRGIVDVAPPELAALTSYLATT